MGQRRRQQQQQQNLVCKITSPLIHFPGHAGPVQHKSQHIYVGAQDGGAQAGPPCRPWKQLRLSSLQSCLLADYYGMEIRLCAPISIVVKGVLSIHNAQSYHKIHTNTEEWTNGWSTIKQRQEMCISEPYSWKLISQ